MSMAQAIHCASVGRNLVDENRRNEQESKSTTQMNEANVALIWARCRLNVESMWVLFPYTNVTMWTPCGLDVDSSPHLEHVVVYQMWTQCGLDVDSLRTLVHI